MQMKRIEKQSGDFAAKFEEFAANTDKILEKQLLNQYEAVKMEQKINDNLENIQETTRSNAEAAKQFRKQNINL